MAHQDAGDRAPTRDLDGDVRMSVMLQRWVGAGLFYQNHVTGEHVWSAAIREFLGLPSDFVVDAEVFLRLLHEDDVLHLTELVSLAFRDPSSAGYEADFRLRHSSGAWRHMRALSRFERDAQGVVVAEYGVLRDVSETFELEQRLITAQRRSALGRIAAGVAHDFNNMLSAVLGEASLQLLEPLPEPQAQAFRAIVDATERAGTLSHRLLTFSRQQVLSARVLDLNESLRGFERILRRVISERCELRFELSEAPLFVHVDPVQIEQVVMNLVVNARDAIEDGGVITIASAALPGTPDLAELCVVDDGVGMSPEVVAHAQDEFFTTKAHGTGLGLATSRQIIVELGGQLTIESELGLGTTVRIRLPLIPDYAIVVGPDHAKVQTSAGVSVLVVEDEPLLVDLALRSLRGFGFTAHGETDRRAALRWLSGQPGRVDVLISDGVMPGVGLAEFLHEYRRGCPDGAIVLVSGYLPEDEGVQLPAGITYLAKPFTPFSLARAVHAAIASWRGR